ncbi:hypothetical protein M8C21_009964, partial [Ambrosia artemisiifolia]
CNILYNQLKHLQGIGSRAKDKEVEIPKALAKLIKFPISSRYRHNIYESGVISNNIHAFTTLLLRRFKNMSSNNPFNVLSYSIVATKLDIKQLAYLIRRATYLSLARIREIEVVKLLIIGMKRVYPSYGALACLDHGVVWRLMYRYTPSSMIEPPFSGFGRFDSIADRLLASKVYKNTIIRNVPRRNARGTPSILSTKGSLVQWVKMSGGGTQSSLRKALGVIKDTTTVNIVKVSSDYKELNINIVKATNHVERPTKEKHIRGYSLQVEGTP